jgi:hypothetical protein
VVAIMRPLVPQSEMEWIPNKISGKPLLTHQCEDI